ncbi:helix-turn-helix domain-containing protein [Mesobacterium pallidum]|uniref:helix-turn-helix domain-containing protein n=1 Tax=Mesobacterium pallidum TaxID=2872037 RepID=UPI001EE2A9FF|nr:AraC family transcriptional regulator [Mesobacterium pallidum]
MFDSPSARLRSGRVECALQERVIGTRSAAAQYQWFVFFLDDGHAVAETHSGEFEMSGPAMRWGPLEEETRLRLSAGSSGYYLFFAQAVLDDAIGAAAESAELRMFAAQHLVASFGRADPLGPRLETLFQRILTEARSNAFGAEISVAAYLRVLLVLFWRSTDRAPPAREATGRGQGDVTQFRHLVEAHFRARWSARQYAEAMGITYDRLHDICMRTVAKPPALLIRERCLHEAQVLLQRTTLSSERIAAMLGFSSASQFTHFFKAMAGETPGAWRKQALARSADSAASAPRFADWP